jgi:hypothetical protein
MDGGWQEVAHVQLFSLGFVASGERVLHGGGCGHAKRQQRHFPYDVRPRPMTRTRGKANPLLFLLLLLHRRLRRLFLSLLLSLPLAPSRFVFFLFFLFFFLFFFFLFFLFAFANFKTRIALKEVVNEVLTVLPNARNLDLLR